jgi:predicted dithiol-disulfide oxidoreductase (DUF899 family)
MRDDGSDVARAHFGRELKTRRSTMQNPIVSRDEWLDARIALLAKEKDFSRMRDQLSAEQRALPWVKVGKEYVFDSLSGKVTLAQLFRGRSQLVIQHFMMAPGATHQCVGCSFAVDHIEGILEHLENHDVSYVVVARAPIEEIEAVRQRMGWHVTWVSSSGSDFNYDFNVSYTPEQIAAGIGQYNFRAIQQGMEDLPDTSIFFKDDAGQVFQTYSCFGRGADEFLTAYRFLDLTPKGRNENGPYNSMGDWLRPRNMYGKGGTVEANSRFHPPSCCAGNGNHERIATAASPLRPS